ncbi:MAG TPA: UvrD-helicase domain-containing protein [Phnomibacter sp.]|nr:UvrD-helicase domain-containing protein [Phnomibacter sp.]
MAAPSTMDIYKASAGSGKTFSLTLHYIELVLQSPANYRRILAVTFTNKATAEMKERILHVLEGLATGADSVEGYRSQLLQRIKGMTAPALQQKAHEVYTAILHDYSRFSVNTIDSFVQRIIRSFAWELGIDGGFKLVLSTDAVREDLAERLYLRLDEDKDLQQWMIDMARERLEDGKRWEFRTEMLELANEMFKEKFSEFEKALAPFSKEEIGAAFTRLNNKVQAVVKSIEGKWKAKGENILQLLDEHHLTRDDFYYGKTSFIGYFSNATQGAPIPLSTRALQILDDPEKMAAAKAPAAAKDAIKTISPVLIRALEEMGGWYDADIENYETAKAIRQNVGVLRLMRVFAEELAAYRSENNALLISDTHNLLRELTKDTTASFIYEKTGNRYQHFLIDEFQDTSAFQWDNFLPLLTEALSQGNYNLIVGDVKQAIYRWRSGDWRLLLSGAQNALEAFLPTVKTLEENYRSAKPVIQFNNLLFYIAPLLLQEALSQSLLQAGEATQKILRQKGYESIFQDAYADSFQQFPANVPNNGMVSIQFVAGKDEDENEVDFEEAVLPLLYQKIRELFDAGFSASDMAVLVRTNREATTVVQYLVEAQQADENKFKVLSGEALLLSSNQVIQMMLCALRWLNDKSNTLALAQLRQLVLLQQGKDANKLSVFASNGSNDLLQPSFINDTDRLRSLPLTELVHQLVIIFEWQHAEKHQAYLLSFCDKVKEWTRYGEASLRAFLQYWDDEGYKLALQSSGGNDAIEVVTVHKSKGLAYNIVLMPFLDWGMVPKGGQQAPIIWANNQDTDFNEIPIVPVKYKSDLQRSAFAVDAYEEFLLGAMDNLNVLYVAFTRARKGLYGWAPLKKAKSNKKSDSFAYGDVGQLLLAVAKSVHTLPDNGNVYADTRASFDTETNLWQYGEALQASQKNATPKDQQSFEQVYTDWRQLLHVKYQGLGNNDEGELVLPRKQGILLHEILGKLKHPDHLQKALAGMEQEGWLDAHQRKKVEEILESVLAMDALKPWHTGGYKRLAERNIINQKGQLRRPDLVLYNSSQTIVVDFKFTATDNEAQLAKHTSQVAEYMELLQQMGFAGVQGQVIYGLTKQAIPVTI